MIHFWQRSISSLDNSATFISNTCIACARAWHPLLQPAARPICIMPSYDYAECLKHYMKGNPPVYDLPEWDPLGCSYFQSK